MFSFHSSFVGLIFSETLHSMVAAVTSIHISYYDYRIYYVVIPCCNKCLLSILDCLNFIMIQISKSAPFILHIFRDFALDGCGSYNLQEYIYHFMTIV